MKSAKTCGEADCLKSVHGRGLCSTHYNRRFLAGTLPEIVQRLCSIEGCNNPHYARGWCRKHHTRNRRTGDPLKTTRRPPNPGTIRCDVSDCNRLARSGGWCRTHYNRFRLGKDLEKPLRVYGGHDVTIRGAHSRVTFLWGKASTCACVVCGKTAQDWAYDGTDPTQLYGAGPSGSWCFYSAYPEFYMPMCKKCHLSRDRRAASLELREYREWKHATGLTINDIYKKDCT